MGKKCKIVAFSGGCHSGKTTTMLRVKEMLEANGTRVVMLDEIVRGTNIISIDDIRSKPSEYLAFQEHVIRKKIAQELMCLDYEDCVVLVDRAIADSIFYLLFYTDKSSLSAEELDRFTTLYAEAHSHAVNTAYNKLYDIIFQFRPIEITKDAGNMRPDKLRCIQFSEYNAITTFNGYYSIIANEYSKLDRLVPFNVMIDSEKTIVSLIKKLKVMKTANVEIKDFKKEVKYVELSGYLDIKWARIFQQLLNKASYVNGFIEAINFNYAFDPLECATMSRYTPIFEPRKAKAMCDWYKKADASDSSILDFFSEYEGCTDATHLFYNSNYGLYAYSEYGLSNCAKVLKANRDSRQACFCINNNDAMSSASIDKLCTNAVQFLIRDNMLEMIVQMRSSNFLSLLPYDAYMFSVFFFELYEMLQLEYTDLKTGNISVHVASIHFYEDQLDEKLAKIINTLGSSEPECIYEYSQIFL